jgi:hypothetical protein
LPVIEEAAADDKIAVLRPHWRKRDDDVTPGVA